MPNSYFNNKKVLVIADAGKNFIMKEDADILLCLDEAKNLARSAQRAGVDVIKFQIHVFEDEQYVRSEKRYDWIKMNERLTPYDDFWKPLAEFCKDLGLVFCVTPMSRMAAEKISDLVDIFKIGSADIVNDDLLHYVSAQKKPVIISSGMSTVEESDNAFALLHAANTDFAVLHCTSIYPCPIYKLNLNMVKALGFRYPSTPIGFSDHSQSTKIGAMAVRLGATLIEKHFTLDKQAFGPDHHMAMGFDEMKEYIEHIRDEELELFAYGSNDKILYPEELAFHENFRKS